MTNLLMRHYARSVLRFAHFRMIASEVRVQMARVDEHYFTTMRVPLASGRGFLRSDTGESPRVAVINQTMASRFWPGQDAIARRFRMQDGTWAQVVGIAGDAKNSQFTPLDSPAPPTV